jgi:Domain of unknown function (DUF4336)
MNAASGAQVTYPPLDVPKPVAENVWIVDSGPHRMLGLPMPVRMTVIRLGGGDLWLHSPTRFDEGLRRGMEGLGRIRHLVAPSIAHWSFLEEWQRNCPDAVTWAAPGLRERAPVRKSGVRLDRDLTEAPPQEWAGEIEQVIVPGGAGFHEVEFFHRPTRTLVLTDLVVNLEPEKLPAAMRAFAWLNGSVSPHGKPPIYLRLVVSAKRKEAVEAATRLVEWAPERVVFSHGKWFKRDGAAQLRRSLAWLLG